MSLENFKLIDNETIDNSIIKSDFLKIYHQQAANLNDSDQNIGFIFGENNKYHQIFKTYLQYKLTKEEGDVVAANRVHVDGVVIRLVNNAFAYCFKEARVSTTGGSDIEHNKFCGQNSTILRASTSKEGGPLCHFDRIDESEAEIENTSLEHLFINNHNEASNKRKIKGKLPLEHICGFCKTFKKITEQIGFHLTFKSADLQDIFYTSLDDNIEKNFDNIFIRSNIHFRCSNTDNV